MTAVAAVPVFRTGAGHASCHHGEILQGVFRDAEGNGCAGLVTLPMHGPGAPGSRAVFVPRPGTRPGEVTVEPAGRTKARRAAVLMAEECRSRARVPVCGGALRLTGDLPVGLGMGSSSSDVIAALRAVADAFGVRPHPGTLARLAVRAEGACDPLMLDGGRPALFAQREGRVLEVFGGALPPVVVVGCALGGGRPVDTLALPAPHTGSATELDTYARLRDLLRRAVRAGDPVLLGRVATESARLGQRRLRHPEFGALETALAETAERAGAVGVQIAHSGSVAGLLLDPAGGGLRRRVRECVRALDGLGLPAVRVFATYPPFVPHPPFSPFTPTAPTAPPPSSLPFEELSHGHAHTGPARHGHAHSGFDRPPGSGPARRGAALPAL
ncbi:GHMP kinase [Streptomyces sp. NPDC048442]|uniref:GHMP family kinase ATP-binding protein n=1 Tax=Streptomyces sp. NPDC048442 TaxID=3154823 RepID=UPI00342C2872